MMKSDIDAINVSANARVAADLAARLAVDVDTNSQPILADILTAIRDLNRPTRYPPRQYALIHTLGTQEASRGVGDWNELTPGASIIRIAQVYYSNDAIVANPLTITGLVPGYDIQIERLANTYRYVVGEYLLMPPMMRIGMSSPAGPGTATLVLLTYPLQAGVL